MRNILMSIMSQNIISKKLVKSSNGYERYRIPSGLTGI